MSYVEVADREGFEPSVQLPIRILSRDVVSASSPIYPQVKHQNECFRNEIITNRDKVGLKF